MSQANKEDLAHPLVSVIIPAYRCERTIAKTIDSALAQGVSMEILVLDNHPTEELDRILEPYKKLPQFHYYKNETNLGASGSRNRGVSLARGTYVAFLDSDDWWADGKLRKQLKRMEETDAVLCSTGRELMTPEGELTGRIIGVKPELTYRDLLRHNSINCSSVLIRRDVAAEFPMEHEDSHEDYIMWLRILKKYGKAVAVNEPLLKYRLSASGKSGSKFKSARMTFLVYRYMGFGYLRSSLCFCAYAWNGVKKYLLAYLHLG